MKVSMAPKFIDTAVIDGDVQPNEVSGKNSNLEVSVDKYFSDSLATDTDETQETNPFDEHIAFYGAGSDASTENFTTVNVPSAFQLITDLDVEMTERLETIDFMEKNYKDLKTKVYASIKNLKESLKNNPGYATVIQGVIDEREVAIRKIDEEIASLEPLRASIINVYEKELENLKEYGKEYYKWHIAHQQKKLYNGEDATFANKPNPFDSKWGLQLDSDAHIGNPATSKIVIASKNVKMPDGSFEDIYDVVNKDLNTVVAFNESGEVSGVASDKDENFNWTLFHNNLTLVKDTNPSDIDADILLELETNYESISSNGKYQAPIDFTVPEYVRMVDGKFEGISESADGSVSQTKFDGTGEFTLERVVKVEIKNAPSISTDDKEKYDYIIVLHGKDGVLARIRITGTQTVAASERALSLNAGYENDEYKRQSGINIVATTMKSEAKNFLTSNIIDEIKTEYGINDSKCNSAISQFQSDSLGLIVYGFHNVCGELNAKNNLVLLEEALEDEYSNFDNYAEESVKNPLITSAISAKKGGYNAVFHKSGNLYANNFGIVCGGSGDDEIFVNVPDKIGNDSASVYVNLKNNNGHVQIGNGDGKSGSWGTNDDTFIIETPDVWFANPFDPDVQENGEYVDKYGKPPDVINPGDISSIASEEIAIISDIKTLTGAQIAAQLKALKDQLLEDTDTDPYDYTGADVKWGGEYAIATEEMNAFFKGWDATKAGFGFNEDDSLPNFGIGTDTK